MVKIRLDEMSWPEVQEVLKGKNVLIIPVGSTEQHGRHLPLNVDSRCATYLADKAAQRVIAKKKIRVLVAPTIHYTDVSTFGDFPGTLGITGETETRLLADITRSCLRQGFKNILFVNGHASNVTPLNAALREVSGDNPEAGLFALNWWALGFETIPQFRRSNICLHADEMETSLSLLIQPENVQMEKAVREIPVFALAEKWAFPDFYGVNRLIYHSRRKFPHMGRDAGVMGDPTVASRETGEKISEAVVKDLVQVIQEIAQSEDSQSDCRSQEESKGKPGETRS